MENDKNCDVVGVIASTVEKPKRYMLQIKMGERLPCFIGWSSDAGHDMHFLCNTKHGRAKIMRCLLGGFNFAFRFSRPISE